MIATISSPSLPRSSTMALPRNANAAGAPLPFLPRRTSSAIRTSVTPSNTTPTKSNPVKITVQHATPPDDDDSSSSASSSTASGSSSGSGRTSRPKRVRGVRDSPPLPVSPSLGLPRSKKEGVAFPSRPLDPDASDGDDDTPTSKAVLPQPAPVTAVRLTLEGLTSRAVSESSVVATAVASAQAKSAPADSPLPPIIIRKKSGQLVKPSLKSSKSAFKGSLSVSTKGISSKSEPATPTAKAVHFDAQLEHIKLFLAEQRPIAVSRDGSPTDETSGTESDFPSWIYGNKDNSKKKLTMEVVNMPPSINFGADLVLEEVKLSPEGNSLVGRVRVRNIAFHKWVAVRFTLDSWQTTSEVTAKYIESAPDDVDIFSFVIRLNDLLARIEEKTLVMALRYHVGGREIWDNNFGGNYIVKFAWQTPPAPPAPKLNSGSDSGSDIGGDLRSRLEKVIQKREKGEDDEGGSRSVRGQSPDRSFDFKKSSFSSRYDIGTSLKNPWKQPPLESQRHSRMHSYPLVSSFSSSSIPWPELSSVSGTESAGRRTSMPAKAPKTRADLGSPRDRTDDDSFRPAPYVPSEEAPAPETNQQRPQRNHARGYFDISVLGDGSGIKRTPPSSRRGSVSDSITLTNASRSYSFPPVDGQREKVTNAVGLGINTTDSESTSESSSATSDCSSLSSPSDYVLSGVASPNGLSPKTEYSQFLNRFCFFTGADEDSYFSVIPPGAVHISRTSSTSSVDDLYCSPSPRLHEALSSKLFSSPSAILQTCDDSVIPSGSSTPISSNFGSRCPTPVAH